MKHLLALVFGVVITGCIYAQQITRPTQQFANRPQMNPAMLTPGWHSDTPTVKILYNNLRYDPKGHLVVKYFITPSKKPINQTMILFDSTYKAVKVETVADVQN